MRALIAIAVAAMLASQGASSSWAEKRIALAIGNGAYKETAPLSNTNNDASDLAQILRRLNFDVMLGIDLEKREMERLIRDFDRKLTGAEIALFYYAGHGLQVSGQNYLVPIDARLTTEGDIDFESVPLSLILRRMEREAKTSIVLLDACRDNPLATNLARRMATRSATIGQGLSRVESGIGTLIGFSTQPGNSALDGDGRNSPYTRALLDEIEQPGRDVLATLAAVRGKVVKATNGKQVPWEHTSLLGPVVLKPAFEQYTGARSSYAGSPSYVSEAAQMWQMIEKMEDASVFEAFRRQFGPSNPVYDQLAANRIATIRSAQQVAALQVQEEQKRAKTEQERIEALKAAEDKKRAEEAAKQAKAEVDRLAALKAEEERRQAKAEQERVAAAKAEEAAKRAKAEADRLAALKAEQERIAAASAEDTKRAKAEADRLAALKAQEEERAKAEQARLAAAKAEEDRKQAKAEEVRLAALKSEAEKHARAEQERLAAAKAEADRKRAKAEEERLAALKAEEERKQAKAEQDRLTAAMAEKAEEERKQLVAQRQKLAALQADEARTKEPRRQSGEEAAPRDPALSIEPGSGQTFRDRLAEGQPCPSCPELAVAPEGEFLMGSTSADIAAVSAERPDLAKYFNWEGPQHKVTMARRFAVGRTHVTRGEFAAFAAATGHKTEAGCYVHEGGEWKLDQTRNWHLPGFDQTDRHPVVCVNWSDANAYAQWLSKLTGSSYRLLSDAEAEYVTRATARTVQLPVYFFGNDTKDLCTYGNGASQTGAALLGWEAQQVAPCQSGYIHTAPVGSFKANAWGLNDVLGNAWSWTADCWNDSHAQAAADGSARTTGDCARRVVRGGSWANGPRDLRSAVRDSNAIGERSGNLGFRLARDLRY
jgi:formylglycine-generating enzyme required for sulfatase activity